MLALLLYLAADLSKFEAVMGPMPPPTRTPPIMEIVNETTLENGMIRRQMVFIARDGDRVPAYLFIPISRGKRPAMLCLHQTTRLGKAEPAGLGGNFEALQHIALKSLGDLLFIPRRTHRCVAPSVAWLECRITRGGLG